jgi:putative transposase
VRLIKRRTMSEIKRTYKYRLYPTPEQERGLKDILWAGWWLYNRALHHRRDAWQKSRRSVSVYEQEKLWSAWRNEEPSINPLQALNQHAGKRVLRRLDGAYLQFLKGKRGRPRFKPFRNFNSLEFTYRNGAHLREDRLYIQSVGLIEARWHRELPDDARIKTVRVLRKPSGWYVCLSLELPDPEPAPHPGPAVGIDMGIKHALALSDGTIIDSLYSLEASLRKFRRLQRAVARKKKGSHRRRKAIQLLARQHERLENQRRDFWHKVSRRLANSYGLIALEDLSLSFMLRNPTLARVAHDIGLGIFQELLGYKAAEAGAEIVRVDPKWTSQMCSGCGSIVEKALSVRVHDCPACGLLLDRDVNAARNILARAVN